MALQYSVDACGVTFPAAYAKVVSGSWTAVSGQITANVEVFSSATARQNGDAALPIGFSLSFPIDLNSTQNVVAQAYEAIKARPEFAAAVDA